MTIVDPREVEISRLKTENAELKRDLNNIKEVNDRYKRDYYSLQCDVDSWKRKYEALESELRELRQRPADSTPNPANELTALTTMPVQSFATPPKEYNPRNGRRRCEKCGEEYAVNNDDTLRKHSCAE